MPLARVPPNMTFTPMMHCCTEAEFTFFTSVIFLKCKSVLISMAKKDFYLCYLEFLQQCAWLLNQIYDNVYVSPDTWFH